MRKVVLSAAMTIDGYIARADGSVDFLFIPKDLLIHSGSGISLFTSGFSQRARAIPTPHIANTPGSRQLVLTRMTISQMIPSKTNPLLLIAAGTLRTFADRRCRTGKERRSGVLNGD